MKQILVPTDFSDCSLAAFEQVKEQVALVKGQAVIHLVSVMEDLARSNVQFAMGFALVGTGNELEQIYKRTEVALEKLAQEHFSDYQTKTIVLRAVRSVGEELKVYTEKHLIDLIVMASHGRSGFSRMFLGSVAEDVIRRSIVPILVIRNDDNSTDE